MNTAQPNSTQPNNTPSVESLLASDLGGGASKILIGLQLLELQGGKCTPPQEQAFYELLDDIVDHAKVHDFSINSGPGTVTKEVKEIAQRAILLGVDSFSGNNQIFEESLRCIGQGALGQLYNDDRVNIGSPINAVLDATLDSLFDGSPTSTHSEYASLAPVLVRAALEMDKVMGGQDLALTGKVIDQFQIDPDLAAAYIDYLVELSAKFDKDWADELNPIADKALKFLVDSGKYVDKALEISVNQARVRIHKEGLARYNNRSR